MSSSSETASASASPVGVDVGGTFTDFVVVTTDGLEVRKEPTTEPQHEGVV